MSAGEARWKIRLAASILAIAVVIGGVLALALRRGEGKPAAVVLITIDTLRADFALHSRSAETPYLDRLAERGVVFTNAYSTSSWTVPSMASLFTSRFPSSHGAVRTEIHTGGAVRQAVLPASLTTLAECFREAGYTTLGIPANLHLSHDFGFSQGFDFYAGRAGFVSAPRVNGKVRLALERAFGANWKEAWKRRPAFLWIHYFDPHDPYSARSPWIERYAPEYARDPSLFPAGVVKRDLDRRYPRPGADAAARLTPLYASEVSYLDERLRRIGEHLGLENDDVLLIVAADHGEEFAEHGGWGHGPTLHEEVVRVPLLFRWPAGIAGGRRIDAPVSLVDVYPTLVELLQLHGPAGLQGESLAPLLARGDPAPSRPVFIELHPPRRDLTAVRDGRWKLVRDNASGRAELYDLVADPAGQRDVAAANGGEARRLGDLLAGWKGSLPPPPSDGGEKALVDPWIEERLRALGYLDEPEKNRR